MAPSLGRSPIDIGDRPDEVAAVFLFPTGDEGICQTNGDHRVRLLWLCPGLRHSG